MTSRLRNLSLSEMYGVVIPRSINRKIAFRAVVIIIALYIVGSFFAVISAQRAADSLFETDAMSALAGGESELGNLGDDLGKFNYRFRKLKVWMFPAHQLAKAGAIIAPIKRQVRGVELLVERIERNHDAAVAAIELGHSIDALRESISDDSRSVIATDSISSLREPLARLRSDSEQVLSELDLAADVGFSFVDVGVSGPVVSLNDRVAAQEAQLAQLAGFSLLLSEVLLADLDLLDQVSSTFDEMRMFQMGTVSISDLSDQVEILANETGAVKEKTLRMVDIAPQSVANSEYGEIVRDLRELNVAIDGLVSGVDTILGEVVGSIATLASAEGSWFEDGTVLSEALLTLIDNEDELLSSSLLVNESIVALLNVDQTGPLSFGELSDALRDRTEPLLDLADSLNGVPRVVAEIFGIDGTTRNYLVLGQTSDELRAAGGFTSSVWLLSFKSGALVRSEYIDVALIADQESLDEYPPAIEELQLHMDAGRMFLRDVGWDPHFPNVGRQAVEIYGIRHPEQIDGVISMTQWAFVDIASALGGLEIDSELVEASELLSVIEKGTDAQGTEFLASLFDVMLDSFSGDILQARGIGLLTTIQSLFDSKDLMIYSEDVQTQDLISNIGWAGAIPDSSGDRLAIVDSNVGWNKVDRNIKRYFAYEVDLSDIAEPRSVLKIGYANDSHIDGTACDRQTLVPRTYVEYLNGCYWNYVRVYVPSGAQLTGSDDLPFDAGAIAVRVGGFRSGTRSVRQLFDANGDYFSGLMRVEPQISSEAVFRYTLPGQIVVTSGQQLEYSLDIAVQAGTRGRSGTVVLLLPDGYEVTDVVPTATRISDAAAVFELDMTSDVEIRISLRESP